MIRRILAILRRDVPIVTPEGPGPDFTSDRARQYHQSNQLGRN